MTKVDHPLVHRATKGYIKCPASGGKQDFKGRCVGCWNVVSEWNGEPVPNHWIWNFGGQMIKEDPKLKVTQAVNAKRNKRKAFVYDRRLDALTNRRMAQREESSSNSTVTR